MASASAFFRSASASSACCSASHLSRSASHAASQVSNPLTLASERRRAASAGLDPLQDRRLGTSLRDRPRIGFADMALPGGRGSQDLFDDFGAELAGGQQEDRLKAEMTDLEKRSACVFEVQGVGPKDEPQGHQCRPSSPHTPTGKAGRLLTSWPCWPSTKLATPVGLPFAGAGRCCRRHSAGRHNPASTRN